MTSRARQAKLDTGAAPLLGSRLFPRDLVAVCAVHDPRAVLLGADTPPSLPLTSAAQARLGEVLDARLRGKRVLLCSGADDALVPYAVSEPLLTVLKDAVGGWYAHGSVVLDDRVYEGVGHRFSADMVRDAVDFLVTAVAEGPRRR